MVRSSYELEPEEIRLAVDWLRLNPPPHPLPLETAQELAAREIGIPGGNAGLGRGAADKATV